jgi:hypothetical protein
MFNSKIVNVGFVLKRVALLQNFNFSLPSKHCRPLLKQIKNSAESHIVLDCSTERIYDVLKQAQQIGMMSDYHSYLITSLDLHSVDLEEFKYGGTNITALRLVDPEKPELQKVVRNWVYGELRYGRKLDLPPPRVWHCTVFCFDHFLACVQLTGAL